MVGALVAQSQAEARLLAEPPIALNVRVEGQLAEFEVGVAEGLREGDGTSRIVVRVDGPDEIPSSETSVVSESAGGVLSRDKAIVSEFVKKFSMRVI